jgi:hypothetical protein
LNGHSAGAIGAAAEASRPMHHGPASPRVPGRRFEALEKLPLERDRVTPISVARQAGYA